MIFFTRELYKGIQPKSGWERRANREWYSRLKICKDYTTVIKPLLPASARKFISKSFHDAVVEKIKQNSKEIIMILDAQPCASGSCRGHRIQLEFKGVKKSIRTDGLVGQWWLYNEIHLCGQPKFSLHALLTKSEIEIQADEVFIKRL